MSRCRYQGGRTFDDFLKFLEEQLEADKGFARHPALDMLATTWLSTAPGPAQEGLITKARTQQPKLHVTAASRIDPCTVFLHPAASWEARHRPAAWARLRPSARQRAAVNHDREEGRRFVLTAYFRMQNG